jgi:hypothetical protein
MHQQMCVKLVECSLIDRIILNREPELTGRQKRKGVVSTENGSKILILRAQNTWQKPQNCPISF